MKTKIIFTLLIVAAIAAVFTMFKMGLIGKNTRGSVIDETPNIVEAVEQIQELCTEYYYDEVTVRDSVMKTGAKRTLTDAANSAGNFFSNLFSSSESKNSSGTSSQKQIVSQLEKELVVIAKVTCRVGFDLKQIMADSGMLVNGDTLFINLPKAKFLETIVNPTDLDIFAESGSWDFPDELKGVVAYAKQVVEQRAINDNILEKADKSGRKILECLFSTMGFKVVFIDSNYVNTTEPKNELL